MLPILEHFRCLRFESVNHICCLPLETVNCNTPFSLVVDTWVEGGGGGTLQTKLDISKTKRDKENLEWLNYTRIWKVCSNKSIYRTMKLAISQLRTAKHLWIVWRDKAKWQKSLKVKIRARNYKRCLITSKKKPQKLFAVSVPRLMTGALYRTVPPNNPCMLCGLN